MMGNRRDTPKCIATELVWYQRFPVNSAFVFSCHLSSQAWNIRLENPLAKAKFGPSFVALISWVVMSDGLGKALPLPRSSGTKPCWWGLVVWVGVGVGTQMSLSQCLYYSFGSWAQTYSKPVEWRTGFLIMLIPAGLPVKTLSILLKLLACTPWHLEEPVGVVPSARNLYFGHIKST